ncbi:hypothetical protein [Arthrobacter rhombi]|uniref:hypothetical protein n=1 Tax=Arthrobacter rhombi TaxID=71253 RepID=UPI003564E2C4
MAEDDRRTPRDRAADEAAWQDLVSRLEDVGDGIEAEPAAGEPPAAAPPDGPAPDPAPLMPAGGPRDYSIIEEPEEDWAPEDPPALGSGNPVTVLAWACAAGAPVVLLLVAILWRSAPMTVWVGLCVVFVAAAGYLAFRLPRHRTDGDDGARV